MSSLLVIIIIIIIIIIIRRRRRRRRRRWISSGMLQFPKITVYQQILALGFEYS